MSKPGQIFVAMLVAVGAVRGVPVGPIVDIMEESS